MTNYVCAQLSDPDSSGVQTCISWVVYNGSFADQLNALSQADAMNLLTHTAVLFAVAWGWNFLSTFTNR